MSDYLTVVAKMKAKSGKEVELQEVLQGLIKPTRAEKGCVNYDLHQSIEDPGLFIFHENWEDDKALDEHLKSAHLTHAMVQAKELLDGEAELYRLRLIPQRKPASRIGFQP